MSRLWTPRGYETEETLAATYKLESLKNDLMKYNSIAFYNQKKLFNAKKYLEDIQTNISFLKSEQPKIISLREVRNIYFDFYRTKKLISQLEIKIKVDNSNIQSCEKSINVLQSQLDTCVPMGKVLQFRRL